MKTDKYMQGILVCDDSGSGSHSDQRLAGVVKRIKHNLKNLKYHGRDVQQNPVRHNAIFSQKNTTGNVDQAIADIHDRLRQRT